MDNMTPQLSSVSSKTDDLNTDYKINLLADSINESKEINALLSKKIPTYR